MRTKIKRGKPKRAARRVKWGNDVTDKLLKAVVAYVEAHEGTVVVVGGIALVQEGPREFNYGIMVRCTGRLPVFKPKQL